MDASKPRSCSPAPQQLPLRPANSADVCDAPSPAKPAAQRRPKPSEFVVEESNSFGNYRAFGSAEGVKLHTAGFEYDRELWGSVLGARVDYVGEVLPVVLLSQWSKTDRWGDPIGPGRETVPGIGLSPLGFRMVWRDGSRVMPFWETKANVFGFTKKILAPNTTYENFGFTGTVGLQFKLSDRYDLRVGVGNQHISNANLANNPGVDVMEETVGLVVHLPRKSTPKAGRG